MVRRSFVSMISALSLTLFAACSSDGDLTTCVEGDKTYNVGDTFSMDCNGCRCTTNGIQCTDMSCNVTCVVGDKTYNVGDAVPSTDCNSCSCTTSGSVECTTMDCSGLDQCPNLLQSAENVVRQAIESHSACNVDSDCIWAAVQPDCFDQCVRPMNKDGEADLAAAQALVNANQCKQFTSNGCHRTYLDCAPPQALSCVDNVCVGLAIP